MAPSPDTILPDVLEPGLRIVFCGSAAGRVSALKGAYYAGPGNKFWPMLAKTVLTQRLIAPADYAQAAAWGIGFTDMNKRQSGADSTLAAAHDDAQAVRKKILRYRPRVLAFTGKRPAAAFLGRKIADCGEQAETVGDTKVWVLPSPSGLARRFWDEDPWFALARAVRTGHPGG